MALYFNSATYNIAFQHSFSIARGREAVPRPPHKEAHGIAAERTGAFVQLGERVAGNLNIPRL